MQVRATVGARVADMTRDSDSLKSESEVASRLNAGLGLLERMEVGCGHWQDAPGSPISFLSYRYPAAKELSLLQACAFPFRQRHIGLNLW